ncbi:hypothetical protein D1007_53171 [Hordeum vulgare]|nr:hypothetical protein D1007_53171 [Hordeum vulgare]
MRCARICTATPRNGSTDDHGLTRVLGKGGFGVVVKVRHRATGVDVALKCLTCSSDDGSGKRRRRAHVLHRDLPREACYLRCRLAGQCSLVLGGLRGRVRPSLGRVLRGRRQPFAEEETRRVMRQLLSGNIIQRDIKPGNILVDGKGVVKIRDLGLAISMASATAS